MASLEDIVRRKDRLILRCAQQRQEIAASVADLRQPIAVADRILEAMAYLRAHPLLLGVGVAVAVALRPRTLSRFALRAFSLWRTARAIRGWARSGGPAWLRGHGQRQA